MPEPESPETAAVRRLEERALNAWPAFQTMIADGWLLRFADGYTKRANSINAWAPLAPVEAILERAAPLYAARGLPVIVRLTPLAPAGSDELLAARGYARLDETIVMTASLPQAVAADPQVTFHSEPVVSWSEGFAAANGIPDAVRGRHDRILAAVAQPAAFASLSEDGVPLGWGLAVVERGSVGLFDIATAESARRRGVARRLVSSLLAFAARHGASSAYLQVVAMNEPAIALYHGLGFEEAYRYHYRVAPK